MKVEGTSEISVHIYQSTRRQTQADNSLCVECLLSVGDSGLTKIILLVIRKQMLQNNMSPCAVSNFYRFKRDISELQVRVTVHH